MNGSVDTSQLVDGNPGITITLYDELETASKRIQSCVYKEQVFRIIQAMLYSGSYFFIVPLHFVSSYPLQINKVGHQTHFAGEIYLERCPFASPIIAIISPTLFPVDILHFP